MIEIQVVSDQLNQESFDELRSIGLPFIIRNYAIKWPAIKKWSDVYLTSVAGDIELEVKSKSDYSNGNSKRVSEGSNSLTLSKLLSILESDNVPDMSYVRQVPLFTKSKRLSKDVHKPNFFPKKIKIENSVVWIGPKETVAQLHWDPADNFFVQLKGQKEFFLVNPKQLENCYPNQYYIKNIIDNSGLEKFYPEVINRLYRVLNNYSDITYHALRTELDDKHLSILFQFLAFYNNCHVSAKKTNFDLHPNFKNVEVYHTTLNQSDAIFIPYIWLHEVHSVQKSISLNWFLPDIDQLDVANRIDSSFNILLNHISCEKTEWIEYL